VGATEPGSSTAWPHCSPRSIALHPFREGNGRTQRAFLSQLARDAGFRLDWASVDRDANIDAARAAADGDLAPMRPLLDLVVQPARRPQRRKGCGQRTSR